MSLFNRTPLQATGPNLVSIERTRSRSELLTAESKRLIQECVKASKRMQQDAVKRLNQRVGDIQFLKKELEIKLNEIIVEIDNLIQIHRRLEKAFEACKDPLGVTMQCLDERMKRFHTEALHDEVDNELQMEKEIIERAGSLLQCVMEQITEQIRLNRSAKYHLEKDLKDKLEAQSIDDSCTLMTSHSINNEMITETKVPSQSMAVTTEEWENLSDVNLTKAEQHKTNSLSLRALVESVLEQTASDMQRQLLATTAAFERNIQEIKDAKDRSEKQLNKILTECTSQQRNKADLQLAIAEKENVLSVAEARLSLRSQRPGKEQCYDPAQSQLLAEVREHTSHINKMRAAVTQSEEKLRILLCCQVELQENIKIKANSLYIDEVICCNLRKHVIIHKF